MPYKVTQKGDQWCVVKEADGKEMGCHPSEQKANAQLAALNISEGMTREQLDDALVEALHAEFKGKATYELDAEVFAPGKWNGYPFSLKDLESMVANFDHFAKVHQVPLKLGHDDKQPLTDGLPALGRVTKLWVANGQDGKPKLMAHFSELPKIVYDAIKAKRYNKVSIELDFDVKHGGKVYDFVMSGVALLGSALPAVNTLADLTAYMGRDPLVADRRVAFSLATDENGSINNVEGNSMPISQEEYDKLMREKQAADDKAARLEAEAKAKAEREQKEAVQFKRQKFAGKLEDAVKDERLTPAHRDRIAAMYGLDNDERVAGLDEKDFDETLKVFSVEKKATGGKATGGQGEGGQGGAQGDAGDRLDAEVHQLRLKRPELTYGDALIEVMNANRELAREHVDATGYATEE